MYTDDELLDDLKRVAAKIGKSPTKREYKTHGQYGSVTLARRFDTWNKAKCAAGLDIATYTDDELLDDLKRVAAKIGKSPTKREYKTHGQYGSATLARRFGTWNKAKCAAGLDIVELQNISSERLLTDLRQKSEDADVKSHDRLFESLEHSDTLYLRRFGGMWQACVRAGRVTNKRVPLSEKEYNSYIQTAINHSRPSTSLYGLIRGFTGLTGSIMREFEFDWLSRINSDIQPILVRVPSEHLPTANHWELVLPDHFTIQGDKKPTRLKPLLQWMMQTGTLYGYTSSGGTRTNRVIDESGIDANVGDLRATVTTHLARRGVSRFEIEMQVGAEKTNWNRSVEDYLLYLYQFEDYCHPDYEPSGVYLDPDSGDAERIESEAN